MRFVFTYITVGDMSRLVATGVTCAPGVLLRILDIHDAKIIGTRNSHVLTQSSGGLMGENKSPSPINLTCSEPSRHGPDFH